MSVFQLFKKARLIFLALLSIYLLCYAAGFAAGKLKWADFNRLRSSGIFQLNRNLEYSVPGYGALLRKYVDWEQRRLLEFRASGKSIPLMLLIFFNNWVVADLTMIVRTVTVVPLVLFYPLGRFAQGLVMAQTPPSSRFWLIWLAEFGGYFLTIFGTLTALLWTLFYKRFRFESRKRAFFGGLKLFGVPYLLAGLFFLVGSYVEMTVLRRV
jgi:hypothetical protein